MQFFVRFFSLGLCLLMLTGCVDRQHADALLVKGCMAGVGALLPPGESAGVVKDQKFTASPEGPDMRYVKLTTTAGDGWLEEERVYECTFEETFGFMKTDYTASIYQIRFNDQIYGKAGNEIQGSFDDFIKLTDAIRKAMYEQ